MHWTFWAVVAGVIVAFLLLKNLRLVSTSKAREHLRNGAILIDVRSHGEFQKQHLDGALNIPLDELHTQIQRHVPDKSKTLLLHCLSGGRSELARLQLKRAGYSNVHNVGSLARAQRLVAGVGQL